MIRKVLIVEDEAIVALDLSDKLKVLGYEVTGITERGEHAVSMARELRPDAVLMDIRLAGKMDGIAAAEQIQKSCGATVIFLTAHSEPDVLERAKLISPSGYVLKPFQINELRIALQNADCENKPEVSRG